MDPSKNGLAVAAGDGERVRSPLGGDITFIVRAEDSNGKLAVLVAVNRPGEGPPLHIHTREDETICVLDGAITAFVGDERIEVEAGSYAALPKDIPHGLTVRGDEARLLVTLAPAGAEYFLVPRDENDADPTRFGLIVQGPALAA